MEDTLLVVLVLVVMVVCSDFSALGNVLLWNSLDPLSLVEVPLLGTFMLSDELLFLYFAKIDSMVYLWVPGPLSMSLFVEEPNNAAEVLPLLLLLLVVV